MEKLPTIEIKGNPYVLVKDRIMAFHEQYPNGQIHTHKTTQGDIVEFKAIITLDVSSPHPRLFTGHSESIRGGKGVDATAACENAETSAIGRGLAMAGIGIIESIASADEVVKAVSSEKSNHYGRSNFNPATMKAKPATNKQKNFILSIALEKGIEINADDIANIDSFQASQKINELMVMPSRTAQDDDDAYNE